MPLTFAETLARMLSVCHRGAIGARLFHLQRCLSSSSSNPTSIAGPLPLLGINGSFLTTPAFPPAPSFSTSSIFCYDREILTDRVHTSSRAFKSKTYFIDLKEDDQGKRYMKLTEKYNGKKAGKCMQFKSVQLANLNLCNFLQYNATGMFINIGDVEAFCEALCGAAGGEGSDMVLSGEEFSMISNDKNCVQIKKQRNDGRYSQVFIEDSEVDEIVRVLKRFAASGNREPSTNNPIGA